MVFVGRRYAGMDSCARPCLRLVDMKPPTRWDGDLGLSPSTRKRRSVGSSHFQAIQVGVLDEDWRFHAPEWNLTWQQHHDCIHNFPIFRQQAQKNSNLSTLSLWGSTNHRYGSRIQAKVSPSTIVHLQSLRRSRPFCKRWDHLKWTASCSWRLCAWIVWRFVFFQICWY